MCCPLPLPYPDYNDATNMADVHDGDLAVASTNAFAMSSFLLWMSWRW
jgi:hypothetical protein